MMELTRSLILYAHIFTGFVALLVGPVAMFSGKGSTLHRNSGKVYFWAMVVVVATAVPLATIRPNLFLLGIAVLSFFLTFNGYRSLFHKRLHRGEGASMLDWSVSLAALAFGLGLVAYAVLARAGDAVLALVFGALTTWLALANLRKLRGAVKRGDWFFDHIVGMLSAYIATFTAFAVTNLRFLPPLLTWLLPSVIGTVAISLTVANYKRRLAKGRRLDEMATLRIEPGPEGSPESRLA